ncbi:hypothetical protein GVX82_00110 [Patescibacteria group bacterium]|nr:hypothetical protein [Patescibacteria group bacterium]
MNGTRLLSILVLVCWLTPLAGHALTVAVDPHETVVPGDVFILPVRIDTGGTLNFTSSR